MKYTKCISPPFYAIQIINPFLNLIISANHDKIEGLSANWEILICKGDCFSIVESLLCDPWFDSQTLGKFNLQTFGKLFPLDRTIFGIVLIYLM